MMDSQFRLVLLVATIALSACTLRPDAPEPPRPARPSATATPDPTQTATPTPRPTAPRPTLAAIATTRAAHPTPTIAPAAASYLQEALAIIESRSLYRNEIDMRALRAEASTWAAGASTPADTYPAIRMALLQLRASGVFNSAFLSPGQWQARRAAAPGPAPSGELRGGRVGYLHLPAFEGREEAATSYAVQVQKIIRELDAQAPCGWIVDLSASSGDNMWPLLAGVGPLLGEDVVGAFVGAGDELDVWFYHDGRAGAGAAVVIEVPGERLEIREPMPPVAVLTAPTTAGAGEAIAVAYRGRPDTRTFGKPTAGLSTATEAFPLSDGAVLLLATSRFSDRTGTVYDGPIPPDELVLDQPADAAMEWLLEQPACVAADPR